MNKYIGLTIGPIYPTLKQAQRTRELWGASYLFSSIFKNIAIKLKDYVVLPYLGDTEKTPVGLYPDRIIFKVKNSKSELSIEKVQQTINEVFSEIEGDMGKQDKGQDYLASQLRNCIQIHAYEAELEEKDNIILKLYEPLEHLELFQELPITDTLLPTYFKEINQSILYEWAGFKKDFRFPSLFDISSYSLKNHENFKRFMSTHYKDTDEYETTKDKDRKEILKQSLESFVKNCKDTFGDEFKPYHKYFALIHADGDNMGQIIKTIGNNEEKISEFSKALFEYGTEAKKIIQSYGGLPVYIGGDDLLFFAPLANPSCHGSTTILGLINELDELFLKEYSKSITDLAEGISVKPTFSYGVAVTYFKFPLKESLELSYNNLLRAKDKSLYRNKNAVVITLQKHSGQQIEAGFEKNDLLYKGNGGINLFDFIKKYCFSEETDEYNSFRRKISEYHPFLKHAPANGGSIPEFIKNNFDYDFNKAGFWKDLLSIINSTYSDTEQAERRKEMLYFAIRFIHFINSDSND